MELEQIVAEQRKAIEDGKGRVFKVVSNKGLFGQSAIVKVNTDRGQADYQIMSKHAEEVEKALLLSPGDNFTFIDFPHAKDLAE